MLRNLVLAVAFCWVLIGCGDEMAKNEGGGTFPVVSDSGVTMSHPLADFDNENVAAAPAARRSFPWKFYDHKHALYKPHNHDYGEQRAPSEPNNPDVDCPTTRHTHHTPKAGETRDAHGYGTGWAHTVDNTPHNHISGDCVYKRSYYKKLHENDSHAEVKEVCQVNVGTNANKRFVPVEDLNPVVVDDQKGKYTVGDTQHNYNLDWDGDGDSDKKDRRIGRNAWKCRGRDTVDPGPPPTTHDDAQESFEPDEQ